MQTFIMRAKSRSSNHKGALVNIWTRKLAWKVIQTKIQNLYKVRFPKQLITKMRKYSIDRATLTGINYSPIAKKRETSKQCLILSLENLVMESKITLVTRFCVNSEMNSFLRNKNRIGSKIWPKSRGMWRKTMIPIKWMIAYYGKLQKLGNLNWVCMKGRS